MAATFRTASIFHATTFRNMRWTNEEHYQFTFDMGPGFDFRDTGIPSFPDPTHYRHPNADIKILPPERAQESQASLVLILFFNLAQTRAKHEHHPGAALIISSYQN